MAVEDNSCKNDNYSVRLVEDDKHIVLYSMNGLM